MGRQPCCEKVGLKRGPWTVDEDNRLMNFILHNGIHCWRRVPKLAGLLRCGKSCRLRWINYLRPDLKRGDFNVMEEDQIIQLHSQLGNRWSKIASHFPGRTDNEIKNHWNTRIKKRLKQLGIDPLTHKPIEEVKDEKANIVDKNEKTRTQSPLPPRKEGSLEESTPTAVCEARAGDPLEVDCTRRVDEDEFTLDEVTADLLNNYVALCGSDSLLLDEGLVQDADCSNPSMSQSCSASVADSNSNYLTASACESTQSIIEDGHCNSVQRWPIEGSAEWIFGWDDFDYLKQGDFPFF